MVSHILMQILSQLRRLVYLIFLFNFNPKKTATFFDPKSQTAN
jgi:hypothetical protein